MKKILTVLFGLSLFVSCGKDGGGGGGQVSLQEAPEDNTTEELLDVDVNGRFKAILRPLNPHANGFLPSGKALITVKDNMFAVKTYLEDDQRVLHPQFIYEGKRCPTALDDLNQDGFVDHTEVVKASGQMLLPLDGDLNSLDAGRDQFPVGKAFTYQRKGRLDLALREIQREKMSFQGKVVILYGTTDSGKFPDTIASLNGLPKHLSIPIVCGVIVKN